MLAVYWLTSIGDGKQKAAIFGNIIWAVVRERKRDEAMPDAMTHAMEIVIRCRTSFPRIDRISGDFFMALRSWTLALSRLAIKA